MAAATVSISERLGVRFQQLVQMHDNIFHLGIVNSPLSGTAPSFLCLGKVRKDSDDVELIKFAEIQRLWVLNATAKDQMKFR